MLGLGISPAWLVLCWRIQIQTSKLRPLHPFINSHLLPSFSTPLFSIPQLPERKGKTSLCSQLVQNVPVLLRGPGAGLGITWTSGLCPQRSRFRPALPASKDRSLSSWGESVAQLPPPHPAMGLCGLVAVLGMCLLPCCGYGPAFDFRPALLQRHLYLPHLTSPSIVSSRQAQGSPHLQKPCHGILMDFCHSSEPAWRSERALVLQRAVG